MPFIETVWQVTRALRFLNTKLLTLDTSSMDTALEIMHARPDGPDHALRASETLKAQNPSSLPKLAFLTRTEYYTPMQWRLSEVGMVGWLAGAPSMM